MTKLTLLERLKGGGAAPVVPVAEKPAAKSKTIPKWMRDIAGRGVDDDGQVLKPSDEQRSVAGLLGAISPRGPRA